MADSLWPSCTATNAGETPGGAAGFADGGVTSFQEHGREVPRVPRRDHAADATRPPPRRAGLQRIASTDLLPIVDDHHHHHTIDHDEVRATCTASTFNSTRYLGGDVQASLRYCMLQSCTSSA